MLGWGVCNMNLLPLQLSAYNLCNSLHIDAAICAYSLRHSGKVSKQQDTKLIFDTQAYYALT